MAKRPQRQTRPVARAPFHRGAYVHQYVQSKAADAFLAEHGESLPLIGSPEMGGRRGSNRSEITPAFLYRVIADMTPADPDVPTITTASGVVMTLDELDALNAEPSIDAVSQHATATHRDRRLMSRATMTRTRYLGPCVERDGTTGRWHTTRAGATVWRECPIACPTTCKMDHKHVRHQHREHGTTFVVGTRPYGEVGIDRQRDDGRPVSKRQGRRARREAVGSWPDATTAVDPTIPALGAYVTSEPRETYLVRHGRQVMVRSFVRATRTHETLPATWVRPAFVPARVKGAKTGPAPAPVLTLGASGLRYRLANDPDASALAGRILLAAEHAWSTNGQPVHAEQGITLVVSLAQGGPTLTIGHRNGTTTTGTYKSRRSLVRQTVAELLSQ